MKIEKIWIESKDVKRVVQSLRENGIKFYDDKTLENLIQTLMPRANKHTINRIKETLQEPEVYNLPYRIKRAVNKRLEQIPHLLDLVEEANFTGNVPVGLSFNEIQKTGISDPTSREAIDRITGKVEAKDKLEECFRAFEYIPPKYRQGVWEHLVNKVSFSGISSEKIGLRTWRRYTAQYKYFLAREMGYAEELDVLSILR